MFNKNIEKLSGSASIELMERAEKLKKQGKDIISLAGGEPDFDTPSLITDTAVCALQEGDTHYAVGAGLLELREKIAEKLRKDNDIPCNAENIIVTPGGKFGIYLAVASLLNVGDEVLVLSPCWVSYGPIVRACGGIPVFCELDYREHYRITEEKILSCITEKTRMIIINYPNNPTGRVLSKEEAEILCKVVEKYKLFVISDEIYEKIVFDGKKNISLASYRQISDRVITINGFSKSVAMTGWRLGYTAAAREVTAVMYKLYIHTITGTSPFIQKAAIQAFSCEKEIEEMRRRYEARRNYFVREINKIEGMECTLPEGAFYAWVHFKKEDTSKKVCEQLLDRVGIIGVDGCSYGEKRQACVRFSFACSQETLEKAIARLNTFYQN